MNDAREKEIRYLVENWPTYGDDGHQAVVDLLDEVERLCKENAHLDEVGTQYSVMYDNEAFARAQAEAKLAKAVEALREARGYCMVWGVTIIDAVLKELEK